MMMFVGATCDRVPGPKYRAELAFAEVAPSTTLPKPQTLARWRTSAPKGFEFSLRVPASFWGHDAERMRDKAGREEVCAWVDGAVKALHARAVVIESGPALTTGKRDRGHIEATFARVRERNAALDLAWKPAGLWELASATAFARTLDVGVGLGASELASVELLQEVKAPWAYVDVSSLGARRSWSPALLEELAFATTNAQFDRTYLVTRTRRSFEDAVTLKRALSDNVT